LPKVAKYIDAPAAADFDADPEGDAELNDVGALPFASIGASPVQLTVSAAQDGWRLDRALAILMPDVSRSRLQQWIVDGAVKVTPVRAAPLRQRDPVFAGDLLSVVPIVPPEQTAFAPEPMALSIVHEDDALIVLDKPPGLVVHPAAGHWHGTLLNGLLAHDSALGRLPRAGIVHRLDADTSGLMVVARSLQAQTDLVRQLQARTVAREYWAVVSGEAPAQGTIAAAIGRDPRNPLRFTVSRAPSARDACTHFRRVKTAQVDGRFFSWVACRLETGRTHQIRVHLESIGLPLVGDPLYRRGRREIGRNDNLPAWAAFKRQALHACHLGLRHPVSGEDVHWFRKPPQDMRDLMKALGLPRADRYLKVFA
jgi:23S rRNA pseudouridine1911/1915/1917 synthase